MIKKIINRPLLIYISILFLFFLIFNFLLPYGGDDWTNYLHKHDSISSIFQNANHLYHTWEGRYWSRILLFVILPHKFIYSFISALLISSLYYFIVKFTNIKHTKIILPLVMMCLILIDMESFGQVYVWRTGSITYLIPSVFCFYILYMRRNLYLDKDQVIRKWNYLIVPLSLFLTIFVENVSVVICSVYIVNNIMYYIKYKRIDLPMILGFIASIIGLCVMLFSPGNAIRMSQNVDFERLSIFEKVLYNIPNLIKYTFIKNSFLVLLLSISMSLFFIKNIRNRIIKMMCLLYSLIIPIMTALFNIIVSFDFKLPYINILINEKNKLIIIYWISFIIIYLLIIIRVIISKKNKQLIVLSLCAIINNGSMMMSPVWGGRTAYLSTISLLICTVLLLFIIDDRWYKFRYMSIILNSVLGIFITCLLIYYSYIFYLNIMRNKYINYQIKHNSKEYNIIMLPGYYGWNFNTWGSTGNFAYSFKRSYGIDRDAKLNYVSIKNVKNDIRKIKISPKLQTKWDESK